MDTETSFGVFVQNIPGSQEAVEALFLDSSNFAKVVCWGSEKKIFNLITTSHRIQESIVQELMKSNFDKQRIARNSILLYLRMLFTMWINLYATRLVLANLGIDEMGVYGVVGSIVGLFAFFTSGLTNTIQRFITFEMGKEDGNVNTIFCSSLNIIILLSAFILILLESVGLWFLYNKVNIPSSSFSAAIWVYQLSVLTCMVNLISIPYNALVIAHEKMGVYAFISIFQVVMTCTAAYSLSSFDSKRLIIYALLMAVISILIRFLYQVYCRFAFKESRYHFGIDKTSIKQIGRFAGVSTISGMIETVYNQGVILVINWTFGVALNAVYTIAMQLKNSVLSFAQNIYKAASPQIIKTYASGEMETHKHLVYSASKIQVYMIFFILIPFMFKTEYILHLWLGEVPCNLVTYTRATIIISLLYAMFEPIRTAVLATNQIKNFMIVPNVVYILILPISYLVSRWTSSPAVLILCVVTNELIGCSIRIYYALQVSPISFNEILTKVLRPICLVAIGGFLVCWILSAQFKENLFHLFVLLIVNSFLLLIIIYMFGVNPQEKHVIDWVFVKLLKRVRL